MSPVPASTNQKPNKWVALAALTVALLCLGLATLGIVRVPLRWLWVPTLVASAWGHFMFLLTLLLLVVALRSHSLRNSGVGRTSFACGLVAAGFAATPGALELSASRDLAHRIEQAFGPSAPRTSPGHSARVSPIALSDVFGIRAAQVTMETIEYKSRGESPLLLDLYRGNDSPGARPIVIVVHGGAWVSGERSEFPELGRYLAARGYAVAAVDYRLAPLEKFPAPVEDVRAAIQYLRERASQLGLDPDRFALLGRSAGGQIALAAAYSIDDPSIRGAIGFYSPTDMIWSWDLSLDTTYLDGREVIRAYLGGSPEEQPELYREASPLFLAKTGSPPTLLIHGARDKIVSPLQSTRLARRLDELGVPQLHIELPSATTPSTPHSRARRDKSVPSQSRGFWPVSFVAHEERAIGATAN